MSMIFDHKQMCRWLANTAVTSASGGTAVICEPVKDYVFIQKIDQVGFVAYIKTVKGRYTKPLRFDFPFHEGAILLTIEENPQQMKEEDMLTDTNPTMENPYGTERYLSYDASKLFGCFEQKGHTHTHADGTTHSHDHSHGDHSHGPHEHGTPPEELAIANKFIQAVELGKLTPKWTEKSEVMEPLVMGFLTTIRQIKAIVDLYKHNPTYKKAVNDLGIEMVYGRHASHGFIHAYGRRIERLERAIQEFIDQRPDECIHGLLRDYRCRECEAKLKAALEDKTK